MNIFLTGDVQVGKTTALNRFMEENGISPLGFRTELNRESRELVMKIYSPGGEESLTVGYPGPDHPLPDKDAFNEGGRLLKAMDTSGCRLILMDELGFLEKDSLVFQEAVRELLDGEIPVVGVLRNMPQGPFWKLLHEMEGTRVLTVDMKNRDRIPEIMKNAIFQ